MGSHGTVPNAASKIVETENRHSPFENAVRQLPVAVCGVFEDGRGGIGFAAFKETDVELTGKNAGRTRLAFPKSIAKSRNIVLEAVEPCPRKKIAGKRVGVLFSGGPAPGGHNILAGLKAVLGRHNTLLGVRKGPKGLLAGDMFEITARHVEAFINTGGFDFLGTDRTKIKTDAQFAKVKDSVLKNKLDGLVVVGGDDSNTNAALIAEYLLAEGIECCVVGVPKTIDGDLGAGKLLPISFGFDTAAKVFSELVGNLAQDAASAVKYWHFVKLMGRTASKITLEVALQTKPAVALISEEIAEKNMSLGNVVDTIVDVIARRRFKGINHGVVLIPEGLVEFIPEIKTLIEELNRILAEHDLTGLPTLKEKLEAVQPLLSANSGQLMASLPEDIRGMLILDRDDHGNVKVSQIETDKLLIQKVGEKISLMKRDSAKYFGTSEGMIDATPEEIAKFNAASFSTQAHFLGYEGRCSKPTLLDQAFTFNLGMTAGSLVLAGLTGYMAAVTDFDRGGRALALPLSGLIVAETRKGKEELVIEKSLVDTASPSFKLYAANRRKWALDDLFSNPGPIQHWGPTSKQTSMLVALDQGYADFQTFDLGQERKIAFE